MCWEQTNKRQHFSSARNERTSRLWARAALFEPAVAPGQARATLLEHSVRSRRERHFSGILRLRGRLDQLSSILRLRARLEQHFSSILRRRGKLERPFRGSCGSGAGSRGHFEPAAAPGQLEVGNVGRCTVFEQPSRANSSALAEPSEFEWPFRAPQRSRAGSGGHFERPSGAERARAAISSAPAEPSGLDVANVGRCGGFEARPSRLSELSCGGRSLASSRGHFERPSGAGRARAGILSAPAEPNGLERPLRAPQRRRAGSMSQTSAGAVFSRPGRAS